MALSFKDPLLDFWVLRYYIQIITIQLYLRLMCICYCGVCSFCCYKALIVIFCVMHESSQNNVSWLFKRNKIITWSFVLNLIPSNIFWNIWMIYWPCQAWIELSLLLTLLSISIISTGFMRCVQLWILTSFAWLK